MILIQQAELFEIANTWPFLIYKNSNFIWLNLYNKSIKNTYENDKYKQNRRGESLRIFKNCLNTFYKFQSDKCYLKKITDKNGTFLDYFTKLGVTINAKVR